VVNGRDSFVRLSNPQIDELGKTLAKYGVKVGALETPVFKAPLRKNNAITWAYCPGFSDDMTFPDHLWYLSRAFEIADRLGAEQVRCFAFWREYDLDDAFNEVVDKLGQAASRAKAAGRTLYLQNEQDTLAGTGLELARMVKAVNSPYLKASYDLANSARLAGVPYPDDYAALNGQLGSVQVKFQAIDVRSGWGGPSHDLSDPKIPYAPFYFWLQENLPISGWVQIGEKRFEVEGFRTFLPIEDTVGVDYRSFFKALKQDGYNGRISVDPSYFIPGAGASSNQEIEANFNKTISSLRKLITEVWA
jgi:sugar phosphate isomerase/epimerase